MTDAELDLTQMLIWFFTGVYAIAFLLLNWAVHRGWAYRRVMLIGSIGMVAVVATVALSGAKAARAPDYKAIVKAMEAQGCTLRLETAGGE